MGRKPKKKNSHSIRARATPPMSSPIFVSTVPSTMNTMSTIKTMRAMIQPIESHAGAFGPSDIIDFVESLALDSLA